LFAAPPAYQESGGGFVFVTQKLMLEPGTRIGNVLFGEIFGILLISMAAGV